MSATRRPATQRRWTAGSHSHRDLWRRSAIPAPDLVIPAAASGDQNGWLFLDLNNPESGLDRPTQNWVVVRRRVTGDARSVDATALSSGCRR